MRKRHYLNIALVLAAALCVAGTLPAHAVTSDLTFVSALHGVDTNPCTRLAPCRTFYQAFIVTNTGGEIVVLDSGGFGYININRAITVETKGFYAGMAVNSGNAIDVSASSGTVVLRGLTLNGSLGGVIGVNYTGGGKLLIENCILDGFSDSAVNFRGSGQLVIKNSYIRNARVKGVFVLPTGATMISVEHTRVENNAYGIFVSANRQRVTGDIRDTVISGNQQRGVLLQGGGELNLDNCLVAKSATAGGLGAAIGVEDSGSTLRLSNSAVFDNDKGLDFSGGGSINSFGNNRLAGNTSDGSFTAPKIALR